MAVCYKIGHFNDNWKVFLNIWVIAIFFSGFHPDVWQHVDTVLLQFSNSLSWEHIISSVYLGRQSFLFLWTDAYETHALQVEFVVL